MKFCSNDTHSRKQVAMNIFSMPDSNMVKADKQIYRCNGKGITPKRLCMGLLVYNNLLYPYMYVPLRSSHAEKLVGTTHFAQLYNYCKGFWLLLGL